MKTKGVQPIYLSRSLNDPKAILRNLRYSASLSRAHPSTMLEGADTAARRI
jgi:hypothetical protein